MNITPQKLWLGHISDRGSFPNFLCKPFCGGPSRFSRVLIGKSSGFKKTRIDRKNPNRERIRVAGAIFNDKRISRVLGQTASLHLLLSPRKLTSCAHNNKCDPKFLLTPIPRPGIKRLRKHRSIGCSAHQRHQLSTHGDAWNDQSAS